MNTEENLDHLETVYINLHCPYKARSLSTAYETLSTDKRLYDRCKSATLVPETERLNQLLFNQVSNKEADEKELPSITQADFEAYRNSFIPSKEEARLMQILFNQVAGNVEADE